MVIRGINKIRGFELVKDAPTDAKLPLRGSEYSAGYDFYAPCDIIIPAYGFSKLTPLNVKAYMLNDEYLKLVVRSSLATTKARLQVSQGTAIIDADYYNNPTNEGNIGVMFYNRSNKRVVIKKGERCCQGIFCKYLEADNCNVKKARKGGYGSTGKK